MASALVAIDPTSEKGRSFGRFTAVLRLFHRKGILSRASVASIIHPSLYAVPYQWYRKMQGEFSREALASVREACAGKFEFDGVKVLASDASSNEAQVAKLVGFGKRCGLDLLVVASGEKAGLPYWILGSFSETAALTAGISVLVIKPHVSEGDFPPEPRFVVAVDPAAPPSKKDRQWIRKLAKNAGALVHLVYVEPRPRALLGSLQKRQPKGVAGGVLKGLARELRGAGVQSTAEILEEEQSVAHTIAGLAEARKAWITITVGAERSAMRRLLLGSTARRILSLTKRPFLSLRME